MTVLRIELVDPRVKILLEDLAKLNLINILEEEEPQKRYTALLKKLRSKEEEAPGLDEITEEVEIVRSSRSVHH
ncbi:MAG: hypothetical protein WA004_17285 [Saprospiraceae bacterium]